MVENAIGIDALMRERRMRVAIVRISGASIVLTGASLIPAGPEPRPSRGE